MEEVEDIKIREDKQSKVQPDKKMTQDFFRVKQHNTQDELLHNVRIIYI